MDDRENSRHRYETIKNFSPWVVKILDMACGCGTFVFYGLMEGYDVYGIDPEKWKHEFIAMKAKAYGYPDEWLDRFLVCKGEELPYPDDFFDCVYSYQTLEHVLEPRRCIEEMFRVTRPGGVIFIQCPDYRGTFEGHYRLPWLPLMPRSLARLYLRLMRRPLAGLDALNYVTERSIKRQIKDIQGSLGYDLDVRPIFKEGWLKGARRLFREDKGFGLAIYLNEK